MQSYPGEADEKEVVSQIHVSDAEPVGAERG